MTVPKFILVFLGSLGEIGGPVWESENGVARPSTMTHDVMVALEAALALKDLGVIAYKLLCLGNFQIQEQAGRLDFQAVLNGTLFLLALESQQQQTHMAG